MCGFCNYRQYQEEDSKKHIRDMHEVNVNLEDRYEKCILIPNLMEGQTSRRPSSISEFESPKSPDYYEKAESILYRQMNSAVNLIVLDADQSEDVISKEERVQQIDLPEYIIGQGRITRSSKKRKADMKNSVDSSVLSNASDFKVILVDDDSLMDPKRPRIDTKNIDKNITSKSKKYHICDKPYKCLSIHYANMHKGTEVYCARMSAHNSGPSSLVDGRVIEGISKIKQIKTENTSDNQTLNDGQSWKSCRRNENLDHTNETDDDVNSDVIDLDTDDTTMDSSNKSFEMLEPSELQSVIQSPESIVQYEQSQENPQDKSKKNTYK